MNQIQNLLIILSAAYPDMKSEKNVPYRTVVPTTDFHLTGSNQVGHMIPERNVLYRFIFKFYYVLNRLWYTYLNRNQNNLDPSQVPPRFSSLSAGDDWVTKITEWSELTIVPWSTLDMVRI